MAARTARLRLENKELHEEIRQLKASLRLKEEAQKPSRAPISKPSSSVAAGSGSTVGVDSASTARGGTKPAIKASPSPPVPRFAPGDVLSVHGLQKRPELNGCLAQVTEVKPPIDGEERCRYGCVVRGVRCLLKEGSLRRTPRGSSAAKKGLPATTSRRRPTTVRTVRGMSGTFVNSYSGGAARETSVPALQPGAGQREDRHLNPSMAELLGHGVARA